LVDLVLWHSQHLLQQLLLTRLYQRRWLLNRWRLLIRLIVHRRRRLVHWPRHLLVRRILLLLRWWRLVSWDWTRRRNGLLLLYWWLHWLLVDLFNDGAEDGGVDKVHEE